MCHVRMFSQSKDKGSQRELPDREMVNDFFCYSTFCEFEAGFLNPAFFIIVLQDNQNLQQQ